MYLKCIGAQILKTIRESWSYSPCYSRFDPKNDSVKGQIIGKTVQYTLLVISKVRHGTRLYPMHDAAQVYTWYKVIPYAW